MHVHPFDYLLSRLQQELFCSYACGWHYYYDTMDYEKIKYAWIGDPSVQCPSACSITTETPNGLLGTTYICPHMCISISHLLPYLQARML
jgi:hypothetical protein